MPENDVPCAAAIKGFSAKTTTNVTVSTTQSASSTSAFSHESDPLGFLRRILSECCGNATGRSEGSDIFRRSKVARMARIRHVDHEHLGEDLACVIQAWIAKPEQFVVEKN